MGDAGLDDQKVFAQVNRVQGEFVIRCCHDWDIEVYNSRCHRWECAKLFDLVATIPFAFEQQVEFTHGGKTWRVRTGFGWLPIRLLDTLQELWVLVAHSFDDGHDLVLLTNVPSRTAAEVRQVYQGWRLRGKIEHGYRCDQEQGLDVADLRPAVLWLRELGGKLGLKSDRNGP